MCKRRQYIDKNIFFFFVSKSKERLDCKNTICFKTKITIHFIITHYNLKIDINVVIITSYLLCFTKIINEQ